MRTLRLQLIIGAVAAFLLACGGEPATGTGGGGGDMGGGAGGGVTGGGSGGGNVGGGNVGGGTGGGSAMGGGSGGGDVDAGTGGGTGGGSAIPYVFVITMENQDAAGVVGVYGSSSATYINNTLRMQYAYATNYGDVLGALVPSEPHYVWLEGGTNAFSDHTFTNDNNPSASNSTSDTNHLVTQLAGTTKTWRSYQEGMNATTGDCPIAGSGFYAPKHDPFIFFQDVSGNPPSKTNAYCAAHHKPFSAFAADLAAGDVASYTFLTPDLCNDMHGASGCSNGCTGGLTLSQCIGGGDAWLAANVPPIITFLNAHGGVLFIVWDEPALASTTPFIVVGPHVKAGHASSVAVSHSSYLKSLQEIFGVPVSSRVQSANDFADFFEPGYFP